MQGDQGRGNGSDGEGDDINSSGENSPVSHRGSGKSSGDSSGGDCETALYTGGGGGVGVSCSTALGKVGSLLSSVRTGGGGGGNVHTNAIPPRLGENIPPYTSLYTSCNSCVIIYQVFSTNYKPDPFDPLFLFHDN